MVMYSSVFLYFCWRQPLGRDATDDQVDADMLLVITLLTQQRHINSNKHTRTRKQNNAHAVTKTCFFLFFCRRDLLGLHALKASSPNS